jgi:hypothetical protein
MDPQSLANEIAVKVIMETNFWVAVVGLIGVIVGAVIGVVGTITLHFIQSRTKRLLDQKRTDLLVKMLDDSRFPQKWRNLSTLARVTGASEASTTRLLVMLGARGSENDDGLWGLLKHHPLDSTSK